MRRRSGGRPLRGRSTTRSASRRSSRSILDGPISVRFDHRACPDASCGSVDAADSTASVGLPAIHGRPSTVVAHVYPSGDVIPENQLRMYIEFSAPMGRRSGIEHVALLDERGQRGGRSVPPARLRVLERGPDAVHRVLRSRPGEARHPAQQADGPRAQDRQVVHGARALRMAGCQRSAAQGIIPPHVSRRATPTPVRSTPRSGESTPPRPAVRRRSS